jgi:hypothetical protein
MMGSIGALLVIGSFLGFFIGLVRLSKKAKQVVIEANFHKDGNRAMVYPIQRLTW